MDVFIEQLVKKQLKSIEILIIIATILSSIILIALSFVLLATFLPEFIFLIVIIIGGIAFGTYKIISSFRIEFEYAVTNKDITIDKIIAKSKRKKVIDLDINSCCEMGEFDVDKHKKRSYENIFDVKKSENAKNWFMIFNDGADLASILIFTPNERVLAAIKKALKPSVLVKTFGRDALKDNI